MSLPGKFSAKIIAFELHAKDDFMYRTDLRVVRMERLYNREAYKRHQNTLQLVTMVRNTLLDDGRLIHSMS